MDTIRFSTLAQVRAELKEAGYSAADADATNQAAEDEVLLWQLREIATRLEQNAGYPLAPYRDTTYLDGLGQHIDDLRGELLLPVPFLHIETVTVGGVTWAAGTDYVTVPQSGTPITALRVLPSSGKSWGTYTDSWIDSIVIDGVSGYHRDYGFAWQSSGDTLQSTINATASALVVGNINGRDSLYRAPRFSAGAMIRIGDEWLDVLHTDISAAEIPVHTLTVRRGVRGSTAASHTSGAAIDVFIPDETVSRASERWVSYLYKRRGSFAGTQIDTTTGVINRFPPDVPEEVTGILGELPMWDIASGVG